jgi:PIN domain nuclease of toxin-antitoxin system
VRVLIDTQVVVAAYHEPEALSKKVMALLVDEDTERLISATTVMEIAIKNGTGKLTMGETEMRQAAADLRLTLLPFTPQHAYRLFDLPLHHRDPFDRMIIATALVEGIPLLGADREFKKYKGLKVIW